MSSATRSTAAGCIRRNSRRGVLRCGAEAPTVSGLASGISWRSDFPVLTDLPRAGAKIRTPEGSRSSRRTVPPRLSFSPRRDAGRAEGSLMATLTFSHSNGGAGVNGGDGRPKSVLVADDHTLHRQGVRQLPAAASLSLCGEAGTLAEARRLAADLRPDLVLLDSELPDGDGPAFVEELRSLPDSPEVVVLCGRGRRPRERLSLPAVCRSRPRRPRFHSSGWLRRRAPSGRTAEVRPRPPAAAPRSSRPPSPRTGPRRPASPVTSPP